MTIDCGSAGPRVVRCSHTGCMKPAVDMHGVSCFTHGYCLEHRTCETCGVWVAECKCTTGPTERPRIRAIVGALLDDVLRKQSEIGW
jgi:hypothetical protein